MKRFFRYLLMLLGLPKSCYLCFRSMKFTDAIRIPIIVSPLTKFVSLNGGIIVKEKKFGTVRIGFDGSGLSYHKPVVIHNEGLIEFAGSSVLGGGTEMSVGRKGVLYIGQDVKVMGESKIISAQSVSIGAGSRVSWNTQIMDTDFHPFFVSGGGSAH